MMAGVSKNEIHLNMGQKANPISLRLKTTNKSFDSCWYSDINYSTLLSLELKTRSYVDKVFRQIRYPKPLVSFSLMPKRAKVLLFFFNPERSRGERGERFQLRPLMGSRPPEQRSHPLPTRPPYSARVVVGGGERESSLLGRGLHGNRAQPFVPSQRGRGEGETPLSLSHRGGSRGHPWTPQPRRGATHLFGLGVSDGLPFQRFHNSLWQRGRLNEEADSNDERKAWSQSLVRGSSPNHRRVTRQEQQNWSWKGEGNRLWLDGRKDCIKILNGETASPLKRESFQQRESSQLRGWMADWERRVFIYSTLLAIAKKRSNTAKLLFDKDFALFYRLHSLVWFEGRGESCLSLINQRQSPQGKALSPHPYREGGGKSVNRSNRKEASLRRFRGFLPIPSNHRDSRGERGYSTGAGLSRALHRLCSQPVLERGVASHASQASQASHASQSKEMGLGFVSLSKPLIREIRKQDQHFSISLMETLLGRELGVSLIMYPYKSIEEEQTAQFLSEEIAYYLERRVPFRRIKQTLMREVERKYIEGVRVSCSGRVGGRSKKAQRAREESFQWGQTSSHVFSSKLCFASRSALTPFGKIGIKVWICYK